jgi:superfamily II DNA/RNA helicase
VHQIHGVAKTLFDLVNLKTIALYGGATTSSSTSTWSLTKQLKSSSIHLAVSTPARLIDFVKSKATNLSRISYVVLDEGDRLATSEFSSQIDALMGQINPRAVRAIFSATFSTKSRQIVDTWIPPTAANDSNTTRQLTVGRCGFSSVHVEQRVILLLRSSSQSSQHSSQPFSPADLKQAWIRSHIADFAALGKCIIFVGTRVDCSALASLIQDAVPSVTTDALHGDRTQSERNATFAAFKSGRTNVLVATDVAARGLDVKDIFSVINYNTAKNLDSHAHRVGRAGRLNGGGVGASERGDGHSQGFCVNLLTDEDKKFGSMLRDAFLREKREVSAEFNAFANSFVSRQSGGHNANHYKNNKKQKVLS